MDEQVKKTWPGPEIVREPKRLSPEQQQAAARHLMQVRVASMFSCAAIDEAQAEAHLRQAYRVAGLEPPQIRWFDSPLSFLGHFAQEIVRGRRWDDVKGRIFYCIRDSMWHRNSMMQRVWHSAWEGLVGCRPWDKSESVWHDMLEIVWQTLYASVWDIVWDGVVRDFPQVDIAWLPVSESIDAYYDVEGLLFYQFFHETCEENDLIHLALFNGMVSGYQLGDQEARLVRMPIQVERDEQGRLHCASGR